jgi:hypothetical protein
LLPLGRQLGRGALSSRSLVQMKMWWSNFGTGEVPFLLCARRCDADGFSETMSA